MNNAKSVELSVRAAMLIKETSNLVGTHSTSLARLVIVGMKGHLRDLEKFLDTAEVEK